MRLDVPMTVSDSATVPSAPVLVGERTGEWPDGGNQMGESDADRPIGTPLTDATDADPSTMTSDVVAVRAHAAILDGLPDRPLSEHADLFGELHASLQAYLSDIDDH